MYYEALRLNVECVMNLRLGSLRGRYLASDGTREWDQLWQGTIPDAGIDDPIDETFHLQSVILEDLQTDERARKNGPVHRGDY